MAKAAKAKKLRFAALIRVSTEKQEKQGESLRTQDTQITAAVKQMGGVIAKRYGGQEHATPGWERKQLDQLLHDAIKKPKPFDAVIVADPSRWSRDIESSERNLNLLKESGIEFYVLGTRHDLANPDARLFLAVSATLNAYSTRVGVEKSLRNRIELAKRGKPASGSMPFGRTYDRKTEKWGVKKKDQDEMTVIAKRYVAGESVPSLCAEFGIADSTLYDRFTKCGGQLPIEIHSEKLDIHYSGTIDMPALLDAKTIAAVQRKAEANQTYRHGHLKHKYLFSRMVFCAHCGSSLSGQFNNGQRYYRHPPDDKTCPFKGNVRADDLENVVIRHLFDCFGNPKAVERAIEAATPNRAKIEEQRQRQERIAESLKKIDTGRERILALVAADSITKEQATNQLHKLKQQECQLSEEWQRLDDSLDNVPTPEEIRAIAKQLAEHSKKRVVSAKWRATRRHIDHAFAEMTWDERRSLVEKVFGGKTPDGKRMGVYIERADGKPTRWNYVIRGNLIDVEGAAPLSDSMIEAYFGETDDFGRPVAKANGALPSRTKKPSSVTKPGRWAPTRQQKYCRRGRSRRRGGG